MSAMATLLAVFALAAPAHATFPGQNGRIAFHLNNANGDPDIWTMNPDGSGTVNVTASAASESTPAWSPDGQQIAFTGGASVWVMDADGGNERQVTPGQFIGFRPAWSPDGSNLTFEYFALYVIDRNGGNPDEISRPSTGDGAGDDSPDWSPDGNSIAVARDAQFSGTHFFSHTGTVTLVHPSGMSETPLTGSFLDRSPSFSPDGETIVFSRQPDPFDATGLADLYTIPATGGTPTPLTETPDIHEEEPVWSPDGTKIAFVAEVAGNTDIYVMNADGTGRQRITTDPGAERDPNWQTLGYSLPGYVRPKSAPRVRLALVPAYAQCSEPTHVHGPPLAYGSCSPPVRDAAVDASAPSATFGTPDANGHDAQSVGSLVMRSVPGNPATEADEADVRITLRVTDVRQAGNEAAGYAESLTFPLPLRVTDKHSGCCGTTVSDLHPYIDPGYQVEAPCVIAGAGRGNTCNIITTADALLSGLVHEGARTVWEFAGPARVYDSGPDGNPGTLEDNAPLAIQGVFVP
jgi:TolB protein